MGGFRETVSSIDVIVDILTSVRDYFLAETTSLVGIDILLELLGTTLLFPC